MCATMKNRCNFNSVRDVLLNIHIHEGCIVLFQSRRCRLSLPHSVYTLLGDTATVIAAIMETVGLHAETLRRFRDERYCRPGVQNRCEPCALVFLSSERFSDVVNGILFAVAAHFVLLAHHIIASLAQLCAATTVLQSQSPRHHPHFQYGPLPLYSFPPLSHSHQEIPLK